MVGGWQNCDKTMEECVELATWLTREAGLSNFWRGEEKKMSGGKRAAESHGKLRKKKRKENREKNLKKGKKGKVGKMLKE